MTFKAKHKVEHIEAPADVVPFEEGAEPFRASVRVTLSRREMKSFGGFSYDRVDWEGLGRLLSPFIVSWNRDAPPPAEVGFDAFDDLTNAETVWSSHTVTTVIREANATTPPPAPVHSAQAAC